VLDDLRALVEFAHAGSIAGAAGRLFRTPSAITRQVQRLEAALGAELLDRSVKPPRLNSLGARVLEHARDLLQRTEALKPTTVSRARRHCRARGLTPRRRRTRGPTFRPTDSNRST
jgi:DNA-binding transcriptional LysR family regulator